MPFADAQKDSVIKYGEDLATITLAGTATKGDILGFSAGWKRALATVSSVVQARCVASEDGVDNQKITAYFGTTVVEGERFSGATVGGALYVAEGTSNGMYTQTAPTTSGDANKIVGYMLSATQAAITPNQNSDSTAA